ncbi:MAG: xylose ABC transporter ATP-binding protein [Pyrinomonadaceae bacterium]|nr:xylose ABC transporter ATP-binding protein [Pyrinomonadaceae bacterium]
MMSSLLEMRNITKEFPGVKALDSVNLDLVEGEFHSLVGENGAGKSTLMKVLSGVYPFGDYEGDIVINGDVQRFYTIREAEEAGIAIIFQELSLVKELTVAENIFLGREPARWGVINWTKVYKDAAKLLNDLQLNIDPRIEVGDLGIGQQQLVEIAKALSQDAKLLVLDEPTAALTESEVETLFDILRSLKSRGVGMIYISHKLGEVFDMSDRITVLRDGQTVATHTVDELDKDRVISLMVGRDVGDIFPEVTHEFGDVALEVKNLNVFDPDHPDQKVVDDLSFSVRKGEVLGIAGLMGAGRSEFLTAIFGAWKGRTEKTVFVEGKETSIESPRDAISNGIGFVTEDRKRYGLILDQTIMDNSTLAGLSQISGGFLTNRSKEIAATKDAMEKLNVKANSPLTVTGTLSGGNQQKVVLGKWLLTAPKVLFLDEPTRGIDVGAKQEIYAEINELAEEGLAIVMVSSELPEVLGLSDRILVIYEGKLYGEFTKQTASPENVMAAATGHLADQNTNGK